MNNDFICFDTESAQGRLRGHYTEELLELSIMNVAGQHLFNHRFKPQKLRKWDPSVHNITSEMVKNELPFNNYRQKLQSIVDNSEYIIGFSLIDDFKAMRNAGIKGLEKKKLIELRHLYWYCVARHENISFYSGPGLSKCAEQLGVAINKKTVHSADGDTIVTLNLFYALMRHFLKSEGGIFDDAIDIASMNPTLLKHYSELAIKRIADAKFEYERKCAAGYIHLVSEDKGVKFVSSLSPKYNDSEPIATISVNARRKAIYDLESMFEKRRSRAMKKIFHLTPDDMNKVLTYQNEFDGNEQMYQKLTGLRRAGLQ